MPTYKNSAGNSGVGAEYANWRYFNANLQRLGEYRSPRLSGEAPRVAADPVVDWMNVAGNVFQGAMGLFEARREYSYKLADDWLSKHSLEEYHKLMQENNIPFQDDPLAMQRLKYRHGKILSEIAEQEFQSRIDKGEFVNMEPEEVDAEHFKFLYDNLKDDSEVFPYQTDGDYFFNQGYWEDSNTNRDRVFQRSQAVSDDYHTQEALLQTETRIMGLVNTQGVSAKAIYGAFEQSYNDYGYRITPNQRMTIAKNILEGLSTRIGDGATIIAYLADKKIPGLGDATFRDVFGDEGLRAYSIKSRDLTYMTNGQQMLDDWTTVNGFINSGNFLGVQEMWSNEMGLNGKTKRADWLFRMMGEARTQYDKNQKTQIANAKGAADDDALDRWAKLYINCLGSGVGMRNAKNDKYWRPLREAAGIFTDKQLTEDRITRVFEDMLKGGEISPEQLAYGAARTDVSEYGAFNPYRNVVSKLSSSGMAQIRAAVEARANGVVKAIEVPSSLGILSQVYQANPLALASISKSDARMLNAMNIGMANGFSAEQQLSIIATQVEKEDTKDFKKLEAKTKTHLKNIPTQSLGEEAAKILINPYNTSLFLDTATWYYMVNGGDMGMAVSSAKDALARTHFNLNGALVPKNYFSSSKYPMIDPQYVAEEIQTKVGKTLEEKGVPASATRTYVDPMDNNKLKVVDFGNPWKTYYEIDSDGIDSISEEYIDSAIKTVDDFTKKLGSKTLGESFYSPEFRRAD